MKTKYIIKAINSFAIILLTLTSCEDSLEVAAPVDQINASQVFESVTTADAALSHLYTEIQAYSLLSGASGSAGVLLGAYTDELVNNDTFSQNAALDIFNNVQINSNTTIKSVWTNAYKEIYIANAIIEGIDKSSSIAEQDRKRIKGEALFLRSFLYFYLNQIFGDIPYPVSTDYRINQFLPKTSSPEILKKIKADLELTVELLNDQYRNTERIYPNRKTAQLLLATLLMSENNWAEAEIILKEVVQNSMYIWQNDISKTFKFSEKHIIWQLKPLQKNYATNEALLFYFSTGSPSSYTVSNYLVNTFDTTDLRRVNWIKAVTINQKIYYRVDKYKNISSNTDEYSVVFRLEEAYLLLAEALVQQNKLIEALPYLNAVKQKAGILLFPANNSKEQMLSEIVTESRKEFFAERGIRFVTLKRTGRLYDINASKPNWKDYHRLWPIPISEILLNSNLNPQNDGY